MTTQDLYTELAKGKITEQKFLYEVRRDLNLPWITQHNSFVDTVQILKNKGMISEKQTKESTGKQEVEIIAKTIDMVNPYEYSKGMNFELDLTYNSVGNADLTEEEVAKAQKKVLKNLTSNSSYYTQKMAMEMEGESLYDIEVNAKSIADLVKKNQGKKGKIIRENEYDEFESEDDRENYYLDLDDEDDNIERIKKDIDANGGKYADDDEDDMNEHGEDHSRVADVNASSSPLEEEDVEELGRKRDSIYEKYAKKHGVDVNELKDKVEARKMETEAIEVDNEQDAINIQKKAPDANVRIVKK